MFSSTDLKKIVKEARPIIERQLADATLLAGIRSRVSAEGGDWSQLKALIKAQLQDEDDESGEPKRVLRILEKADNASSYAELLGLDPRNLNEQNFSDNDNSTARETLASTTAADPAGEADDASSADTLQEGSEPIEAHNLDRAGSTPAPATTSTEQPTRPLVDEAGQHDGGIDRGSVDSEPEGASIGAKPSMASEPAGEATSDASPVAPFRMKQGGFNDGLYSVDWLRRHGKCLNEDGCVVAPGRLCKGCSLALQVEAGGQVIEHRGVVA